MKIEKNVTSLNCEFVKKKKKQITKLLVKKSHESALSVKYVITVSRQIRCIIELLPAYIYFYHNRMTRKTHENGKCSNNLIVHNNILSEFEHF